MGGIRKKKKLYNRPKKPWDKKRIEEENQTRKDYGLKNKKEIWKAEAKISSIRRGAKAMIKESEEKKNTFFEKLNKLGLNVNSIPDVLGLTLNNWLDRRLQTFVFKKGLANSVKEARQKIVHKHVAVDGSVINIPSFIVTKNLEDKISLKAKKNKTEKKAEIAEEKKNE